MPVIVPAAGAYTSPITVSASADDAAASLRYTSDSTSPTVLSPLLPSGGFVLDHSATVQVIATRDGWVPSTVASAAYQIALPPVIMTHAAANPSPVTTTSTVLDVSASDPQGGALTYQWSADPEAPAAVVFSAPTAASTTATFSAIGSYPLRVAITSGGGQRVEDTLVVSVIATPTALAMSPTTATVVVGATQTFSAVLSDQFGQPILATVSWNCTGAGNIDPNGVFTAGASAGYATLTAQSGDLQSQATIYVTDNTPPTIISISAIPVVRGRTALLAVSATDDGGSEALRYTWSMSGPAAATITPNAVNEANQSQATFSVSGPYVCTVQVIDIWGAFASSSFDIQVAQEVSRIDLPVDTSQISPGATRQLHATVFDQFDTMIEGRPLYWSSDAGRISDDGLLTVGPWAINTLQVTVVCLPVRTAVSIPVDRSQSHVVSPLYTAPVQAFNWESWLQDANYRASFLRQPIPRLMWMTASPAQALGHLTVPGVGRRKVAIGPTREIPISVIGVPGAPVFAMVDRPDVLALLGAQNSTSADTAVITGTCGPDGSAGWWIRGLRNGEARMRVVSPVSSEVVVLTIQCGAE
jgi:hypothetical protein